MHLSKIDLKFSAAIILMAAVIIAFTGCSKEDSINPGHVTLSTSASRGHILVDGKGKPLYVYTKDVAGQSMCTGECLTIWPVYYTADIKPGKGIDAADFATITHSDGIKQTTYKGWPLYNYAGDVKAGSTDGDGVDGIWFVAKPNYSIMLANTQLIGLDGKNYLNTYVEGTGETQYLVDAKGRTLYIFKNDYVNKNTYTKSDFSNNITWPIFYVPIDSLPSKLKKTDFGKIDVFGSPQLTYKGHPLYYFGEDAKPGENKGVSAGPAPGTWKVVSAETVFPTVLVSNHATFGNILTDALGRTLYFFAKDTKGVNESCTGDCIIHWPIFHADTIVLQSGSSLNLADFGTTGDGASKQTTYKGWPLYYLSPGSDGVLEAPGLTGGDNIGSVWFVAKPDYTVMVASAQLVDGTATKYTDVANTYAAGTGLTQYFVDVNGRTLYLHVADGENRNLYTDDYFSNDASWPIFSRRHFPDGITADELADLTHLLHFHLPTGIAASDFNVVFFLGRPQLTYKGYPLYYYGVDGATRNGSNKGFAVGGLATEWRIVNTEVVKNIKLGF